MSDLKIGMVGLDTSHVVAFTKLLNRSDDKHHVGGGKVVKAFPGGTKAFSLSHTRVEGYTKQLRDDFGVAICGTIAETIDGVDAVFLESCDGRQHLEQFRQIAPAGVPVFIDKPLACSAADAEAIAELSAKHKAPVMSCSAIRYAVGIADVAAGARAVSAEAFGPASILPDYPGLFWYGVHSAEVLFRFMGKGCRKVQTFAGQGAVLAVGQWEDGRVGTLRGFQHEKLKQFGITLATDAGVVHSLAQGDPPYYAQMLKEVIPFFRTGKSPIDLAETLDIVRFLEGANRAFG